jgi:hypothetical protein
MDAAEAAGLDEDAIEALVANVLRESREWRAGTANRQEVAGHEAAKHEAVRHEVARQRAEGVA